jgi:hypothetical protein
MPEEPLLSSQAILPGDVDRQLTLPPDLIHRGLELAQRLQHLPDVQPAQSQKPQEFLVRCHPIRFEVEQERESDSKKSTMFLVGSCIDLMVSIGPEGMTFFKIESAQDLDYAPVWHDGVYAWLKSFGTGDPPCIRNSDYGIFYYYYEHQGKRHLELVPSEKLHYSGPIVPGNPQHMKAIAIFLIRENLPVALQMYPLNKQGLEDLETLQAVVRSIKRIKQPA